MIALTRRRSPLAILALVVAAVVLALALGAQNARAASYERCSLSQRNQEPPGGTPAYNLRVKQRNTSCRAAIKVMKAFHKCRTEKRYRCGKRVIGRWRCAGKTDAGRPTFHGTFTCKSANRRIYSSYQQDTPACYGAAARDPKRPCTNPTRSVFPPLGGADPDKTWQCDTSVVVGACVFGVPAAQATGSFALVGDSHTVHWRSALSVVAQAKRWTGYTIATGGCFFSEAVGSYLPGCVSWYQGAQAWLQNHPEVSTLFVTSNADTPVSSAPGKTSLETKVDGFKRAWQALPKTVKRVIVLRDTPRSRPFQFDCLQRVVAAGVLAPGPACPLPRSEALRKDTGVSAVLSLRTKRYRSIDLTRYFCDEQSCYGVIGGASVHVDIWGHLVTTYMRTLGPYLLRKLNRLL